jgi:hypothetical protein
MIRACRWASAIIIVDIGVAGRWLGWGPTFALGGLLRPRRWNLLAHSAEKRQHTAQRPQGAR